MKEYFLLVMLISLITLISSNYLQSQSCSGNDCLDQIPWSNEINNSVVLGTNCILFVTYKIRDGYCQPFGPAVHEIQLLDIAIQHPCPTTCIDINDNEEAFRIAIQALIFHSSSMAGWSYPQTDANVQIKLFLPECWKEVTNKTVKRFRPCVYDELTCCLQTYILNPLTDTTQIISNVNITSNSTICPKEGIYNCNNHCETTLPSQTQGIISNVENSENDNNLFATNFNFEQNMESIAFTFDETNNYSKNILIFDILGNQIINREISSNRLSISIDEFSNGFYFFRIADSKENINGKFIILK